MKRMCPSIVLDTELEMVCIESGRGLGKVEGGTLERNPKGRMIFRQLHLICQNKGEF